MLLYSKFINFIFYEIEQTKLNILFKKKKKQNSSLSLLYVPIYKKDNFFCVWFKKIKIFQTNTICGIDCIVFCKLNNYTAENFSK